MTSGRSRRCYHRIMSGLERGGELRFLTLTSSPDAPVGIQRSWRKLYMRMRRRNLVSGYLKVVEKTKSGHKHLHIIFRGSYIDQKLLSYWWQQIHNSKVVDIRQVDLHGSKRKIANYLAKYLIKEASERYSWSWYWVWPGFCRHWAAYKSWYTHHFINNGLGDFSRLLLGWKWWLQERLVLHIPHILMGYSPQDVVVMGPSAAMLRAAHPAHNLEIARCHV